MRVRAGQLFFKSGGEPLAFRVWEAPESRGTILLLHDLGDHSGRYRALAEALREAGFTSLAFDLRGHGRSAGRRGHVESFDAYAADLAVFRRVVSDQGRPGPEFILGHGLGGLVTIHHLLRQGAGDAAGVVLASPALKLRMEPGPTKLRFARALERFWPTLGVPNAIPPEHLVRDSAAAEDRRADRLAHRLTTPRMFLETLRAMDEARRRAAEIDAPLLVLAGSEDSVVSPQAMRDFVEAAASSDKRLIMYPGFYHDLFVEKERARVIGDLTTWLRQRPPA